MPEPSRSDVRNAVPCPKCGAMVGKACVHTGKGALKKIHLGSNHHERQKDAHQFFRRQRRER